VPLIVLCGAATENDRVTQQALLQQVWGPAYRDARYVLRTHIANLRRKIDPPNGGLPLIKTHWGWAIPCQPRARDCGVGNRQVGI
jgi:DNA-binding response OmpR family regulator